MKEFSSTAASEIYELLSSISEDWLSKHIKTRYLTGVCGGFEQILDITLLRESFSKYLEQIASKDSPSILFIDRKGGGEGKQISSGLIEMAGSKLKGALFVHISMMTPEKGVGALLSSALVRKGVDCGVLVDVVSINRPLEGLKLKTQQMLRLTESFDLIINWSGQGIAGMMPMDDSINDSIISLSNINILSFLDPEHIISDLEAYEKIISARPGFGHIRFWVQIKDEKSEYKTIGHCILGSDGDAHDRLWVLMDHATRYCYRVLAEPVSRGVAIGTPLVYPCKRLLEEARLLPVENEKIVQAGSEIVLVGKGKGSLHA